MHDEKELPSHDVVRSEVDSIIAEQERRGGAFDNKAGLLLGLSGVLIGLTAGPVDALRLSAHFATALAATAAIVAMLPRTSAGLQPRAIRDRYIQAPLEYSKQRMLDTRIWLYEMDEKRLSKKIRWIRISVSLVGLAVALLVTGTLIDFFVKEAP